MLEEYTRRSGELYYGRSESQVFSSDLRTTAEIEHQYFTMRARRKGWREKQGIVGALVQLAVGKAEDQALNYVNIVIHSSTRLWCSRELKNAKCKAPTKIHAIMCTRPSRDVKGTTT
jgi:hypothetical protein